MQPDDLEKELSRLWARVSASSPDAPSPAFSPEASTAREITLDAMALLKRQHRHQERSWADMLEARERALQLYKERQQALEAEVGRLREQLKTAESRAIAESIDAQAKLEAGLKSLDAERGGLAAEQKSLRELLDATRRRLSDEAARAKEERAQWDKREGQYLADLKELQELSARRQEEGGRTSDEARKLSESLKDAKGALEKTLSELLAERQARQESERDRSQAVKKVDEVERHFAELSKLWEEERAQWRELWDRERSTWETQRREFADWEQGLRKEREAWHAELQAKEQDQVRFVSKVNESLRQSTETATKMAAALKLLEGLGFIRRLSEGRYVMPWKKWLYAGALASLAGLYFPASRYWRTPRLALSAEAPAVLANPTAMAGDGALLWVSDFDGTLSAFDPASPAAPVKKSAVVGVGAYHPGALAFGGDALWSVDSAQGRLLRHDPGDPSKVLSARPAPGPAPTALAFDGTSLWSYDAVNRALYRHGADGAPIQTFPVEADLVPSAMLWVSGSLWLYDSKSRSLAVLDVKGSALRARARVALGESALGLALVGGREGRRFWLLAAPGPKRAAPAWLQYKF